ncbi:MAG: hypothetical protein EOM66_10000, partial [Clostridia bacterium]|nr:hypothetical protein [Clostridia bacterium]
FQVGADRCSITARCVSSIMLMPEQVVHFPQAPAYCRGLIHLRGQVIPLMDTRTLFGMPTLEQEYADFCAMLDARKQDHLNWVEELDRCLEEDVRFPLATDHHLCALGKWYDSFTTDNNAVMFHLHKLDEPHQRFHVAAHRFNECKKKRTGCGGDLEIRKAAKAAREENMPLILKLLEEAKEVFLSSYQAIVIVLEGEQGSLGLIVDKVHSVETVIPIDEDQSNSYFSRSSFVSGVAKSEKTNELMLTLNHQSLLDLCQGLQY